MAYIVPRRNGRFEIREAIHTTSGPRSRSLANFARLTEAVLSTGESRATRPFDRARVLESAARASVPVDLAAVRDDRRAAFVDASRRFAADIDEAPRRSDSDPGQALIDLMGFAEQVGRSLPPPRAEPLEFPVMSRLREGRP